MTSGRFPRRVRPLVGALALASATGCGGGTLQPCDSNCPSMEGRYALRYEDGGFNDTGECGQLPLDLPEGPLTLTRSVSQLTGTLEGQTLNGTLYNTGEFILLGTGPTGGDAGFGDNLSLHLSGTYTPPRTGRPTVGDGGTAGDGGTPALDGGEAQLSGLFNGTRTRSAGAGSASQRCQVTRRFTATRQP